MDNRSSLMRAGPFQPAKHGQNRLHEVAGRRALPVGAGHQVHRHLGVGVAGELNPGGLEFGTQCGVVLDDPVVHDRELAGGVAVRMGVAIGRAAMGGPAGVTDAGRPGQRRGFGLG
jgi:hypothetical protein